LYTEIYVLKKGTTDDTEQFHPYPKAVRTTRYGVITHRILV